MSTLAVEPPGRRSLKRAQAGTRRLAELLIVLAALWGLWEGSRWLWIHEGWTWPFDTNKQRPLLALVVGQSGGTPQPSSFPQSMLIDWVRVTR